MTKHSRRAPAPEFCSRTPRLLASPKKEGGGAPKGASSQCPRRAIRCRHLKVLRARCPHPTLPRTRRRAGRGLASRRSAAALAKATERFGSAQAALHAKGRAPALPAPSIALKRSTPRPGRSAGGDDARAARERSYELRPQEPHSLHQSAVTGDWLTKLFVPQFSPDRRRKSLIRDAASRLTLIHEGPRIVGRAAISMDPQAIDFEDFVEQAQGKRRVPKHGDDLYVSRRLAFGGFNSSHPQFWGGTNAFFGVIEGNPTTAARYGMSEVLRWDMSKIFKHPEQCDRWLTEQTHLTGHKRFKRSAASNLE
jgi:hypothetical protein